MMVVLFSATLAEDADTAAYEALDKHLYGIVGSMPGFLSVKEYTAADGETIGVVRFESEEALEAWRRQPDHQEAQRRGREEFYARYDIEVLRLERASRFERPQA